MYQTQPYGGAPTFQYVGGTSLGAPSWAALIAIVDQGRAVAGKGSLDGPTQTLPALYSLPSTDFYSISSAATYPGVFGPFGGSWSFGGFPFRSPSSGLGSGATLAATTTPEQQLIERLQHGHRAGLTDRLVAGLGAGDQQPDGSAHDHIRKQPAEHEPGPPSPLHPKGGKQHRPVRRGHTKPAKKTHAAVQAGHKLVAQGAGFTRAGGHSTRIALNPFRRREPGTSRGAWYDAHGPSPRLGPSSFSLRTCWPAATLGPCDGSPAGIH